MQLPAAPAPKRLTACALVRAGACARSSGYPPPPTRRAVGANGAAHAKGRPSPFAREQGKGGQAPSRPSQARRRCPADPALR